MADETLTHVDTDAETLSTDASASHPEPSQTESEPDIRAVMAELKKLQLGREQDRAEIQRLERIAKGQQSASDKAYRRAMEESRIVESHAKKFGIDEERLPEIKRQIIDETFAKTFSEPEPPTPQPNAGGNVSRDALMAYAKSYGLDDDEADDLIAPYVGVPAGDGVKARELDEALTLAKANKIAERRRRKQQKADAEKAGEALADFNGSSAPALGSGGRPVGVDDRVKEELKKYKGTGRLADALEAERKLREKPR